MLSVVQYETRNNSDLKESRRLIQQWTEEQGGSYRCYSSPPQGKDTVCPWWGKVFATYEELKQSQTPEDGWLLFLDSDIVVYQNESNKNPWSKILKEAKINEDVVLIGLREPEGYPFYFNAGFFACRTGKLHKAKSLALMEQWLRWYRSENFWLEASSGNWRYHGYWGEINFEQGSFNHLLRTNWSQSKEVIILPNKMVFYPKDITEETFVIHFASSMRELMIPYIKQTEEIKKRENPK